MHGHVKVKNEIKFLYTKKEKLNDALYKVHLKIYIYIIVTDGVHI
jgi:hypothetical protein